MTTEFVGCYPSQVGKTFDKFSGLVVLTIHLIEQKDIIVRATAFLSPETMETVEEYRFSVLDIQDECCPTFVMSDEEDEEDEDWDDEDDEEWDEEWDDEEWEEDEDEEEEEDEEEWDDDEDVEWEEVEEDEDDDEDWEEDDEEEEDDLDE